MARRGDKKRGGDIIIKREEVVEGGHHGGAWKVAYADFVTAMMAFFLLLWLLSATTEQQRKGLADYFTPSNALSHASSGTGKPFGGSTPYDKGTDMSDRGAMAVVVGKSVSVTEVEDDPDVESSPQSRTPRAQDGPQADGKTAGDVSIASATPQDGELNPGGGMAAKPTKATAPTQFLASIGAGAAPRDGTEQGPDSPAAREKREREAFDQAANQIRDMVRSDPALADIGRQLSIDLTPEGLRLQLLDEERKPMFSNGSAVMADRARMLLERIAPILAKLPEPIAISGHTDAAPYKGEGNKTEGKSNWDLSADRANATRRLLSEAGVPETRFRSVTGTADRDPLLPADPLAAANRRIAIVVLRTARPAAEAAPMTPPASVQPSSAGPEQQR